MAPTARSATPALAGLGTDVAEVREREPFELAEALGGLTRDDLEFMTLAQAEVVVAATQRLTNALAAIQTAAVTTCADRIDEDLERYRQQLRDEHEGRRAAAEAAGREFTERWYPVPGEAGFAAAALAPLLHVSPRTMATRVRRARRQDHEMPGTWWSVRCGDLEPYRAEAIVRASEVLEVEHLTEYEARIFAEDVTDLSTGQLADRSRRAASATDRASVEEVASRARDRRSVLCGPDRDVPGLTTWTISLPTDVSARMWSAVDALGREYQAARRAVGDEVPLTCARADALGDLVLGQSTVETTLELVVPVAALTDASEVPPEDHHGRGRGHEPGFGRGHGPPLGPGVHAPAVSRTPAEVLRGRGHDDDLLLAWVTGRELHTASALEACLALTLMPYLEIQGNPHLSHDPPPATDTRGHPPLERSPRDRVGAWFVPGHVDAARVGTLLPEDLTRLLTHPQTRIRIVGSSPTTGAAITDATAAYRPGRPVVARVRRRDGTCRFPGCGVAAARTELDHVVRWPDGPTEDTNLVCLCVTHHGFKHHSGWRLTMTDDGVCTWTAPTGRRHATRPRAVHSDTV